MRRLPVLPLTACLTVFLVGTSAWLQDGAPGMGEPSRSSVEDVDRREVAADVAETASSAEVAEALARVDAEAGALVEEWIAIASTPASSGHEERRARIVEESLDAAGLETIGRDAAGNVIGVLPGRDRSAKKSVFMAHMDTVAPPAADFTVRREGDVLRGPGVRDDSSGLAAILAAARIARAAGIVPPSDVLVVASVEEEVGLKGSKAFLESRGGEVGAFVAVDGYLGQISWAATSILWMRLHFMAPGAHTLRSYQHPSTSRALAMAVESIYAIPLRRSPEELETWLNVGMLGGGEVPNAQARDAWFTVDLRSNDPETARQMERRILGAGEAAARRIGVEFDHEVLQRLEGATIPGHDRSRLVQTARAALEWLGWEEISLTPRGTADHNIAIQMGIPAIALGVTTGEGAHTPTEHADVEPYVTGVKQLVLLMASPLY